MDANNSTSDRNSKKIGSTSLSILGYYVPGIGFYMYDYLVKDPEDILQTCITTDDVKPSEKRSNQIIFEFFTNIYKFNTKNIYLLLKYNHLLKYNYL